MRGKPNVSKICFDEFRITPAGAGKTHLLLRRNRQREDHPRRCGENLVTFPFASYVIGSPPQVRGKPTHTPLPFAILMDHPRRCGENKAFAIIKYSDVGSPPQVRGKLPHGGSCRLNYGITPAGAGKTSRWPNCGWYCKDHPRRCGENINTATASIYSSGSPPQVRGKHDACNAAARAKRITPAGAGKTEFILDKGVYH